MAQYIFKVNQKICSCKDCRFTVAVKDREYLNEDGSPVYHRGCVYLGVLVDLFYASRHSECPFNELPPHGRLVDADANREDFMDTVYSELYSDGDNYRANRIIDAYDNAPTVLEANNG